MARSRRVVAEVEVVFVGVHPCSVEVVTCPTRASFLGGPCAIAPVVQLSVGWARRRGGRAEEVRGGRGPQRRTFSFSPTEVPVGGLQRPPGASGSFWGPPGARKGITVPEHLGPRSSNLLPPSLPLLLSSQPPEAGVDNNFYICGPPSWMEDPGRFRDDVGFSGV